MKYLIAILIFPAVALSDAVYQCGATFTDKPCEGGKVIETYVRSEKSAKDIQLKLEKDIATAQEDRRRSAQAAVWLKEKRKADEVRKREKVLSERHAETMSRLDEIRREIEILDR